MEANQHQWTEIEDFIKKTMSSINNHIDPDTVDSVNHYLKHAEYELAFEGLFIEIMKIKIPVEIDLTKAKKTAELLKLNEESVLEPNFWSKFDNYIKGR